MTPYELMPKEDWDERLRRFAQDVRMTACLTDDAGAALQCQVDRYPLCAAIRQNEQATAFICSQCSAAMLAVVRKTHKPEIDICDIGLMRVVLPLVRDGELIGQVTACGLGAPDEELDAFLAAKQLGMAEEAVVELAKSTPLGSPEALQPLVSALFEELNP